MSFNCNKEGDWTCICKTDEEEKAKDCEVNFKYQFTKVKTRKMKNKKTRNSRRRNNKL